MQDKQLYATILGIQAPWHVTDVVLKADHQEVEIHVRHDDDVPLRCPQCRAVGPRHDHRERRWRHLDTCQYRTILVAAVPRIECPEHKVVQVGLPWAEPGSRFTALMERLIIDWLLEANTAAVARQMRLTWHEIDGVKQRAVRRGLARRALGEIRRLGVDETAYQKRHEYVTVVSDLERGCVLYVADDRTHASLDGFWPVLSAAQRDALEAIAMDMAPAYIRSAREHVPGAERKICFDRFHVAKMLNDAVNTVRKEEHRELRAEGDSMLAGTKYVWTQNPENMPAARRARFEELRDEALKVGRAWTLKEAARGLWSYVSRAWAAKAWKHWIAWALRSRLAPMRYVAKTIRDMLWGIVNAIVLRVTNARAESLNARIQWIKKQACGYRSRARFKAAIFFHLGGLDLYPRPALAHTKA